MSNWLVGKTLYERTLEGKIKFQEDAYKNLGLEMDKICVMWDEDRAKLKQAHEERDKYKKALEEIMKEFSEGYDVGETAIEMYYIAKGAVKNETK